LYLFWKTKSATTLAYVLEKAIFPTPADQHIAPMAMHFASRNAVCRGNGRKHTEHLHHGYAFTLELTGKKWLVLLKFTGEEAGNLTGHETNGRKAWSNTMV
jgi:hypothetical protein